MQNQKLITELNKTWEDKLQEASKVIQEREAALKVHYNHHQFLTVFDVGMQDAGVAIQLVSSLPHFVNLNEDPCLSGSLIYYLKEGNYHFRISVVVFTFFFQELR